MAAPAAASISKTLANLRRGPLKLRSSAFSTVSSVSETPYTQPPPQFQGKRRGKWSNFLLFLPGAITFGLGTWQIFRREEKIKMLEYRQKRLEMEPLEWNKVSPHSENSDSLEFRRIVCRGVFDEKRSVYVGPRSRSISGVTENGYYLITPLMPVPDDNQSVQSPILVNRGWVPRSWRDKSLEISRDGERLPTTTSLSTHDSYSSKWRFWSKKPKIVKDQAVGVTPVEVVGVVRGSEKPSIFVPANEPSSFQWFYIDVPAIARASGLAEDTIYVEDVNEKANPSKPYPIPKDADSLIRSSVMPQDHLHYTLTWYSLSAAVTFMASKRLKKGR